MPRGPRPSALGPLFEKWLEVGRRRAKSDSRLVERASLEFRHDLERVAKQSLELSHFNQWPRALLARGANHAVPTRTRDHVERATTDQATQCGHSGTVDRSEERRVGKGCR